MSYPLGFQTSMSPLPVQYTCMEKRFQMNARKPEYVLLPSHLTPLHKAHPNHNHNFLLASPFASSWASCLGPHIPWVHYSSQNSPLNENMFLWSQKSLPKCHCTKVASRNGSVIVRSSSSRSTSLQSTSHCRMFVCLADTGHPHLQRFLSSFSSFRRFSPDISTAHVLTLFQVFPSSTILWLTRL